MRIEYADTESAGKYELEGRMRTIAASFMVAGLFAACVPPVQGSQATAPMYAAAAADPYAPVPDPCAAPTDRAPDTMPEDDTAAFSDGPPPGAQPATVRVSIVGALIGPSKADGRDWDGPGGKVSSDTIGKLTTALAGSNPYAAAGAVIADLSQTALDKPDPFGFAEVEAGGPLARVELPRTYRDTFTPLWSGASFSGVPLRDDVRIRVSLIDKDLVSDDAIGLVELTRADLVAALAAGNVYPVRVAEQSANQILYLNVSVSPE